MTGLQLAQYRIDAELGRGGMGIVYRATDTKLNRTVALKVLPAAALSSEDDRARFFREAQAAAQLSHPNIAGVHQIDEAIPVDDAGNEVQASDGPRPFIAMEFIDGETVTERTRKGPLALREAVTIAGQVAEALKAAHAKGIVHRDIKSANVMLTPDGVAKVLDFGLAKTNQSTMLTRMGSTLGTVAYMSPEQARGQEVDGRTDLYALGTMLYEMVAGRLPFAGDYEQAVLYSILNEPPEPLTALRTGVPMELERIVAKLMSKEAEYRYQTAADLIADLKALDVSGSGVSRRSMAAYSGVAGTAAAASPKTAFPNWVIATIVVAALVVGAVGAWWLKPGPEMRRSPSQHFVIYSPDDDQSMIGVTRDFDVAPDGSAMVHESTGAVRVRRATDFSIADVAWEWRDGEGFSNPMFSPSGEWVAYDANRSPRLLLRTRLTGESPRRITELPARVRGGDWARDGYIYLGLGSMGIGRVAEEGGSLEMLIPDELLSESMVYESPMLLPNGRSLIAAVASDRALNWDQGAIVQIDLETGKSTRLVDGGSDPRFVAGRWLVYYRAGVLYARLFDGRSAESLGDEVPVASEVASSTSQGTGAGMYAVTDDGTLFKLRGSAGTGDLGGTLLAWADGGALRPVRPDQGEYYVPRVQVGGRLVVVQNGWFGNAGLVVIDGVTGNEMHRIENAQMPVWSPDGTRLAYGAGSFILARPLDDFEKVDTLVRADTRVDPTDWSGDGRYLLYNREEGGGMGASSIRYLDFETRVEQPYLAVNLDLDYARFSPDGKWVTYEWGPVGGSRAAVRRFPGGEDEVFASPERGSKPMFSADGRYVYFSGAGIMRTEFDPVTGRTGTTEEIFEGPLASFGAFDVSPDDGRLLLVPGSAASSNTRAERARAHIIDVIVNWTSDFPQPK